ncbi:Spc98 family-domain-containing protein [Collybia nuda]|uniref:Spc98 family-domain-containing protein n=1 Tax=Collybia nuda TaxID=64659 RepID=A0A9P5Y269_9AGAR|nr:Spc98 family-domain-containing protein [Collybia nuda]
MLPSTSSTSSGLSVRPPSSLSTHRPPSNASVRPHSRVSVRSQTRHARSKLIPLSQTLVTQITGLEEKKGTEDEVDFITAVDFVVKNLEATTLSKGAVSVDMGVMDRQIRGHSLKARLNSQDVLAEALEKCYEGLKTHIEGETDLDKEIKKSRLPDHLQFLIKLSAAPSPATIAHASWYLHNQENPPAVPVPLTWASIVAEEPFEGDHWEGLYGLPPGFVRSRKSEGETGKAQYDREKESERLDWDSRWSTPSLSPLNSEDLELDDDDDDSFNTNTSSIVSEDVQPDHISRPLFDKGRAHREPPHTYAHRKEVEALKEKQYWRDDWKGAHLKLGGNTFDISDASTLGPTLSTVLRHPNDTKHPISLPLEVLLQAERYINEQDAVREVLMALQGRKNILLTWREESNGEGKFTGAKPSPRLLHLSLGSQESIISSLARTATTLQRLRNFVAVVFDRAQNRHAYQPPRKAGHGGLITTRTLEAFADAIATEIMALDGWCAQREEEMCQAWGGGGMSTGDEQLVVSLLRTENDIKTMFQRTFEVLLDVVESVNPMNTSAAPTNMKSAATISAALLDRLFENVQEHLERQEVVTSEALMRVFVSTAEPMWGMIDRWLRDGMGLGVGMGTGTGIGTAGGRSELDDEFFIESSGLGLGMMGMGLLDPDFWKEGYALREGVQFDNNDEIPDQERRRKTIPMFLEHVAELVLGAGKAVGLLRALGVPSSLLDHVTKWRSFTELVGLSLPSTPSTSNSQTSSAHENSGEAIFSVSIDTLSRLIYDKLLPQCSTAGALLAQVLADECFLWSHLQTIEGLFLMMKGDAMSHFTDILFAKMDTSQSWGDFHFLNTAFRDVVESNTSIGAKVWVSTSLVRLSYRGSKEKDKTISRTVKAIDGLLVEYAVPFPLTYIFRPNNITIYGEIFVFLIQIRRAKNVLERILVRGTPRGEKLRGELKAFYAMRSRLSWFINTLLNFLTTYVIHTQVVNFYETFRAAKSLDEMIQLHDEHLDKIQGRCLLKSNTSSLHRAILSILDMSLQFSEFFITFAGDTTTTHDVSRLSMSTKRHRSRRQRRQRRNIIGFSQSLDGSFNSSDEDEEAFGEDGAPEPSFSVTASVSYGEEGFQNRMDKMASELDGLVRFLRRGVESLAGGIGEAAPAFGVLAFALEDWDI